jgi:hypothetical protein
MSKEEGALRHLAQMPWTRGDYDEIGRVLLSMLPSTLLPPAGSAYTHAQGSAHGQSQQQQQQNALAGPLPVHPVLGYCCSKLISSQQEYMHELRQSLQAAIEANQQQDRDIARLLKKMETLDAKRVKAESAVVEAQAKYLRLSTYPFENTLSAVDMFLRFDRAARMVQSVWRGYRTRARFRDLCYQVLMNNGDGDD